MKLTRREFVASVPLGVAVAPRAVAADKWPRVPLGLLIYSYGIRARAEKDKGLADPLRFLHFAHERGANAIQIPLGAQSPAEARTLRRVAEKADMALEGIVAPPTDDHAALERFTAELATAHNCGATVVRTVLLAGRRYETFTQASDYTAFVQRAQAMLQRAEPVAKKHKVHLAVENHKDFRTEELLELLKAISSEFVGVCIDTGNNLALLEEAPATIAALAPYGRTVHLKDMAVEEAPDGFRLAEVPLGQGVLDLPALIATIRKAQPKIRFHLEMITRDPLSIPCLTEKYWATLERVSGRALARMLAFVRQNTRPEPLPRISSRRLQEQLEVEEANVRASWDYVAKTGLIPQS
ncbi:MAG: sugar phosphate isomerase/epimerase family protein [Gemmataceae bacterium]|nr:sugar phosphate isomerase/epimerase [Gemmata sp.]MDW8198174.1 sugar phosphate isomerase/epimerase family protein [Gemmataceae bacterium]